jgi:hypothetical protein
MRTRRGIMVALDDRDRALLDGMSIAAGESRTQILRWALRLYALRGPWTADRGVRVELIPSYELVTGPRRDPI